MSVQDIVHLMVHLRVKFLVKKCKVNYGIPLWHWRRIHVYMDREREGNLYKISLRDETEGICWILGEIREEQYPLSYDISKYVKEHVRKIESPLSDEWLIVFQISYQEDWVYFSKFGYMFSRDFIFDPGKRILYVPLGVKREIKERASGDLIVNIWPSFGFPLTVLLFLWLFKYKLSKPLEILRTIFFLHPAFFDEIITEHESLKRFFELRFGEVTRTRTINRALKKLSWIDDEARLTIKHIFYDMGKEFAQYKKLVESSFLHFETALFAIFVVGEIILGALSEITNWNLMSQFQYIKPVLLILSVPPSFYTTVLTGVLILLISVWFLFFEVFPKRLTTKRNRNLNLRKLKFPEMFTLNIPGSISMILSTIFIGVLLFFTEMFIMMAFYILISSSLKHALYPHFVPDFRTELLPTITITSFQISLLIITLMVGASALLIMRTYWHLKNSKLKFWSLLFLSLALALLIYTAEWTAFTIKGNGILTGFFFMLNNILF